MESLVAKANEFHASCRKQTGVLRAENDMYSTEPLLLARGALPSAARTMWLQYGMPSMMVATTWAAVKRAAQSLGRDYHSLRMSDQVAAELKVGITSPLKRSRDDCERDLSSVVKR